MVNKITIFRGEILRQVSIKQTHFYPGTFIRNESAKFYTIVDALAPTAQNSPELYFRFINYFIQSSLLRSLVKGDPMN